MEEPVADLINSEPRSPSLQELQTVLRGGYVVMGGGTIDHCREAIESLDRNSAGPAVGCPESGVLQTWIELASAC